VRPATRTRTRTRTHATARRGSHSWHAPRAVKRLDADSGARAPSFGFHRLSPRELLSGFLGTLVQVEGIVTKCACAAPWSHSLSRSRPRGLNSRLTNGHSRLCGAPQGGHLRALLRSNQVRARCVRLGGARRRNAGAATGNSRARSTVTSPACPERPPAPCTQPRMRTATC